MCISYEAQGGILIIDVDKALVLLLTQKMIKAGYEVISAFDGVQGLRLAFQENPYLIVLDIRFPRRRKD